MAINSSSMSTNAYNSYNAYNTQTSKTTEKKTEKAEKTETTSKSSSVKTSKLTSNPADLIAKETSYGKAVGDVKLSDTAAKYYEDLKKKFGKMDFILVSKDQMANVKANASSYASPNKMVVLIDEEKIERMATDENYRKKYEAIISNAASGMNQLKESLEKSGQLGNVKGFGMQVNDDGTASYFAVLKKQSKDQKERIETSRETKRAEKKAAKKAAEKKHAKEAATERAKEKHAEKVKGEELALEKSAKDNTVTISADSIDELMQKISDFSYNTLSNQVQTKEELQIGQTIDFKG